MTLFDQCLAVTLKYEGGYSNHPADPGGVTLEGIIQRVYDAYRKRNNRPLRTLVKSMRGAPDWIQERNDIYHTQYWNAVRADELPRGVNLVVFDAAVNSGPYQAALWLQRALGVEADGHIGVNTLNAARECPDHDVLIAQICARRLGMLRNLKTWKDFGDGWSARVSNVRQIGQAWATGSVGPQPVAAGVAKAYASDVIQPAIDADTSTKSAVGGGALAGLIQGAQVQLQPFVGTSDWLNNIYLGLTIAGIAVAVGGIGYSFYASHKSGVARRAIEGNVVGDLVDGAPA